MIRYHGGPITPEPAAIAAWRDGHAMISFANPGQVALAFEVAGSVALDNGAFPIHQRGDGAIDVPAYLEWVEHWRRHPAFDWCLMPDIIDGTEEENDDLIEKWPLSADFSTPVWHMHEPTSRLKSMVEWFPRVAIGSSGEFWNVGSDRWWIRMQEAMEVACDSDGMPITKLHGLRQMDSTIFARIPYHSVDSTNLARNIGIDDNWTGSYIPERKETRALVIRDNLANHTSARRWNRSGIQMNMELLG